METHQKAFLEILRCAMAGEPVRGMESLTEADWQRIAELASIHKVLPLVGDAVHPVSGARECFSARKPEIRRQVMLQAQRTHAFLELNRKLREAVIRVLVVKGIACRSLYPKGDLRLSADEDLLVAPGYLDRAKAVLETMGLSTAEQSPEAYEYPYRDPHGPLYIELHAHLFPPDSEAYGSWNGYFRQVFDRAEVIQIQGEPVQTMAPSDHMLYLILHAFKHFLHSGVGIRQVCDIVQCTNAWGSRVDWAAVMRCCREIRADGFTKAVLTAGEKYLGLNRETSGVPGDWLEMDAAPLLEDMLSGGLYGDSSRSRKQSSNMTLDAVTADKRGKRQGGSLFGSLFPKAEKLEGRYPYLKDQPWLLPVAWTDRIIHYAGELKISPGQAAETVAIGNRRLELLRKYGVID